MNSDDLLTLTEDTLDDNGWTDIAMDTVFPKSGIGILMLDATGQRLIEGAAVQLELTPVTLHADSLDAAQLGDLEMIVADRSAASTLRTMLAGRERRTESVSPALIVVTTKPDADGQTGSKDAIGRAVAETSRALGRSSGRIGIPDTETFDGELVLPLEPIALLAQLSLVLYAHRAFARRYHSTLEELSLNRRIFRSVTSGISVANASLPDMPLVYVNPAFEVMTGYSLEDVVGKNCRFLQGEDTDQAGLTLIRQAIEQGREAIAVIRNYRKDGTPFWNELSLSPIRNRDGELTHFVGIQTDVTARVEFEAALRESEKLAAVGRLASSIAHEINNPLEAVTNLLYLARQTENQGESRRYLEIADKELQRVSVIAAQSLRFYKQSSKPQLTRSAGLLDSLVDLYHGRMVNAHVACTRRDRATRSIVCMESEIRQVLNNLLRNAIDAMRATGGRLLVRSRDATNYKTGATGVAITIADTGSGISPETMKRLFTPFFTTKGINGTGLGLWISSEIVDRHHGRLRVRSSQRPAPTGTVFELFLPSQGVTAS